MKALDFDIIIVGASVAGAASAVLFARQGHRVLVIDKKHCDSDYKKTVQLLYSVALCLLYKN